MYLVMELGCMFLYLMVVMVIIVYYMDMKMFENDLMFVILV